jgi:hypothetical protein
MNSAENPALDVAPLLTTAGADVNMPSFERATNQLACAAPNVRPIQVVSNFLPFFVGKEPPLVTTLAFADLVAMLDRDDHPPEALFAVVSKRTSRPHPVTTVLDVRRRKLYRAVHDHGMVQFWKVLASRRAPNVRFVQCQEMLRPEECPK